MNLDPQTQREIRQSLARSAHERGPRWALRTISAIAQMRHALPTQRPLEGRTAIILGAGPSLDLAGPHLERWQRSGAVLISTNTAARAAVHHGVQPDVVCFAELDSIVATHLEGVRPGCVVLSTYVSQEVIDAANAACPGRVAFAFSPEPAVYPLALQLGLEPLWYFGCVAVMAIAVARYLGCCRIILAGVDAAYTDRLYCTGSPFEDLRPYVARDLEFVGRPVEDLLITLSDLAVPSKKRSIQRAVMVPNNAGGQSLSEPQLLAPIHLFGPAARGCPLETISPHAVAMDGVHFLDASEVEIPYAIERGAALKPVWNLDARSLLEQLDQATKRWDPHDSVYPPTSVPLASFWGVRRSQDPIEALRLNRELMADARQQLLEALQHANSRPWP